MGSVSLRIEGHNPLFEGRGPLLICTPEVMNVHKGDKIHEHTKKRLTYLWRTVGGEVVAGGGGQLQAVTHLVQQVTEGIHVHCLRRLKY